MFHRQAPSDRWAVTIFRIGDMSVQIHGLFVAFAAATLLYAYQVDWSGEGRLRSVQIALGLLAILLMSVFLHEVAHALAACCKGGQWRSIVIGPLGGMGQYMPPAGFPLSVTWVFLAGPAVHAVWVAIGAIILYGMGQWRWEVLLPLTPIHLLDGPIETVAIKCSVWINWLLFCLNVLPLVAPDGKNALKAVLLSFSDDELGANRGLAVVARLLGLACLLWAAWLGPDAGDYAVVSLIVLGLLGYFGKGLFVQQIGTEVEPWMIVASGGPQTSPVHVTTDSKARGGHREHVPNAGAVTRAPSDIVTERIGADATVRLRESQRREYRELVDELLERVRTFGLESLSPEEREVLRRAARR